MSLELIDKLDNIEIVRDQVAALLVGEIENQKTLATAALKNPDDWQLRVFIEQSNPWEQFLNNQVDTSPLVNIWIDSASYDQAGSNGIDRQKTNATINVDCYGYGESSDVPLGGHITGDKMAALEAQRALRLVRNILMAGENTYLKLRGLVGSRWPQSLNVFQPPSQPNVQQIVGARLTLEISFNEFSNQVVADTLDYVAIGILRAENGAIVLESEYQYPLP